MIDYSDLIAEWTKDFTGREWIFAEVDQWLAAPDAPRYFIITGESGIGKTAIAARLTQIRDLAAVHFCITRQADTIDPLNFARSLSHQLTRLDGFAECILEDQGIHVDVHINVREIYGQVIGVQIENLIGDSRSATVAFNRTVVDPLKKLYTDGFDRQLVILVDALDEAVQQRGPEAIVDLLANARGLPPQVRFVLTLRPEDAVLRHFKQLHIPHLVLNARREENLQDVQKYIRHQLETSAALQARLAEQQMQPQAFVDRVTTASQGNFLYLVWLLPAIAEGTQRFDALEAMPKGLDSIYREFLRTRTVGEDIRQWRACYRPSLGVLAAAQAPLTAEQLAYFTGLSEQEVDDILLDVQQFLDPIGAGRGQYRLYHQSVADFMSSKEQAGEFWIDLASVHSRIATYYQENYGHRWPDCDLYGLRYLPWHLMEAGRGDDLAILLGAPEFIEAFQAQRSEHPWLQLRSALNQFFGPYPDWPSSLRACLEESDSINITFFLADTYAMEGRYDQAVEEFEKLRAITEKCDATNYSAACVRLATIYERQNKPDEALAVLDALISQPETEEQYGRHYWWIQYHRGINLHNLRRHDRAKAVLEDVRNKATKKNLAISALHQLGVIDIDEGKLEQAKEKFTQCLKERGDDEYNHRRAFEYRRLGQVYATMNRFGDAQRAFANAIAISTRCGDWRYVGQTREDIVEFLIVPHLQREQPEIISLPDLARRFGVEEDDLAHAFRLLQKQNVGYLEVIDAESAKPTGQAVRWDTAHAEERWHASVTVLIVDDQGDLALQQRGELDSKGRWDVSAGGHQDVGESDVSAAVRETQEELGITISLDRLVRFGAPYEFRKEGNPSVTRDDYESLTSYVYRTNKTNCERVSVFIVKVSEEEKKQIVTGREGGALDIRWVRPLDAAREADTDPKRFASSFKQLFGQDEIRELVLQEIKLIIGSDE